MSNWCCSVALKEKGKRCVARRNNWNLNFFGVNESGNLVVGIENMGFKTTFERVQGSCRFQINGKSILSSTEWSASNWCFSWWNFQLAFFVVISTLYCRIIGPKKLYEAVKASGKFKIGTRRIKQGLKSQETYNMTRHRR
jgi:hypothetical protein